MAYPQQFSYTSPRYVFKKKSAPETVNGRVFPQLRAPRSGTDVVADRLRVHHLVAPVPGAAVQPGRHKPTHADVPAEPGQPVLEGVQPDPARVHAAATLTGFQFERRHDHEDIL